jgi:tetratricopeptide (TPR) repeat protein
MWLRALAWAAAALFVLVIIAAESRAVWVLALLMGAVVLWKIAHNMAVRITVRRLLAVLAVLLGLVVALVVAPQKNPLARLPVSLGERVTGHILDIDQLRRETRLRILVVSLAELFPRSPVLGSGIGSFQWVYPEAQGQYFQAHPDSRLGTTTKRTDLAHNDYLQVLVETGFTGLVLLLGCLAAAAADVRRGYLRLSSRYDRAACGALAAPAVAVALHATVDFPMHVASIAVLAVFSLQLARGLEPGGEPGYGDDEISDDDFLIALQPNASRQERRALAAGFVITALIFAWTPWAWQALVGRELVSNAYYNSGRDWLERFYTSRGQAIQQKFALLDRAQRTFRQAVVSNVFNGEAYEGQATARVNRAAQALQYLTSHPDDAGTTLGVALRSMIQRDSSAAVSIIYNQLSSGGLRYHFTWYLLGRAWRMQWELERDEMKPEDSQAYGQAVAALRKAVAYNPADAAALRELADLLSQGSATREEGVKLLGRLFKIDPYSARSLIIDPALEFAAEGETTTALAMLEQVFEDYAGEPMVLAARAWLAFYTAVWPPAALDDVSQKVEYLHWRRDHLSPARDAVAALPDDDDYGDEKRRLEMLYAAAGGELKQANAFAKKMLADDPDNIEARVIFNWTNQELFGGGMPAMDSVEYFQTSAVFAVYFMTKREQGLVWAGQVYARGGKLTLAQARRLAAFCVANEFWDVLRRTLPVVLEDYPGDERLQEVARQAGV